MTMNRESLHANGDLPGNGFLLDILVEILENEFYKLIYAYEN